MFFNIRFLDEGDHVSYPIDMGVGKGEKHIAVKEIPKIMKVS